MLYGAIYGFRSAQIVVRGNFKNFNFYYFYNVIIIEIIKCILFLCHFFYLRTIGFYFSFSLFLLFL